jgi:hypothetical protein
MYIIKYVCVRGVINTFAYCFIKTYFLCVHEVYMYFIIYEREVLFNFMTAFACLLTCSKPASHYYIYIIYYVFNQYNFMWWYYTKRLQVRQLFQLTCSSSCLYFYSIFTFATIVVKLTSAD